MAFAQCGMSLSAEAAKVGTADQMQLDGEGVLNGGMRGQEAQGGKLALGALHNSLPPSDGGLGFLGPIVLPAPSRPVKVLQIQNPQGCWV